MSTAEKYLKPEVIRQIGRLDLRAQFIVQGLPARFARQSRSTAFRLSSASTANTPRGDNPQDIDWLVYAKTDKYYIKKFEAETNITGYLVMDLSRSMGYTYRQTVDQVRLCHLPGRGACAT